MRRSLLLLAAVALGAPAAARERSPEEWSQVAVDDLHFVRGTLRENHPGPLDDQNPAFRRWFAQGFDEALALARRARSYSGYYFALQRYLVGFQDGHLGALVDDRLADDIKLTRRWPGFILRLDGDSFKVAESSGQAPPAGATLESCDGNSPAALAKANIEPYLPLWSLPGSKFEDAPYLLIDEGNPFVRRPAVCTFRWGGRAQAVRLNWMPIANAALAPKVAAAEGHVEAPTGIRPYGAHGWWVTLSSFNANSDSDAGPLLEVIRTIETDPARFRNADVVVLDVRGNTGGNSEFGKRLAAALWGKAFVNSVPNSAAVDWRVSALNLRQLERGNLPALEKRFGKDDPKTRAYAQFIDDYRAALKRGDTFFRETFPRPAAAAPAPMRAKVFLLTDGWCHSACLDFADLVLAAPGVTQVGARTSGDTVYIDNSAALLPSGSGWFGWSMKVHRGRPRGNNQSYIPRYAWSGSMADTAGLEAWNRAAGALIRRADSSPPARNALRARLSDFGITLHDDRVNEPAEIGKEAISKRWQAPRWYGTAALLVTAAYFLVFRITRSETLAHDIRSTICNVVPLLILSPAALAIVRRFIIGKPAYAQLLSHAGMAIAFSLAWYWLVMIAIGVSEGGPLDFRVEHYFPTSAAAWQLLQGLTVYGLIAALAAVQMAHVHSVILVPQQQAPERKGDFSRYFVRRGEDIKPINLDEIISIAGADDYAEVTTIAGRHLAKMTLAQFEEVLDGARFKRIHRSRIINIDRVERAEPAGGGRMLLHMQNGEAIQTSRAGAQLLRERIL